MQKSILINFKQFLSLLAAAAVAREVVYRLLECLNRVESVPRVRMRNGIMREETDNHSIKMQHPLKTVNMSHYEPRESERQTTTTTKYTHTNDNIARSRSEKSPLSSKTRYKMQLNFHKQIHIEIVKMSCTVVVLMLMLLSPLPHSLKHISFGISSTRWGIEREIHIQRFRFFASMRNEAWICEHEIV